MLYYLLSEVPAHLPWHAQEATHRHNHSFRPIGARAYVRRRLAALGLEGLLLAVRTLSVTRLRLRLSAPSLDPKSEEFLSLLDFSVAFPKLPEDEKTGRQDHLAGDRSCRIATSTSRSFIPVHVGDTLNPKGAS